MASSACEANEASRLTVPTVWDAVRYTIENREAPDVRGLSVCYLCGDANGYFRPASPVLGGRIVVEPGATAAGAGAVGSAVG